MRRGFFIGMTGGRTAQFAELVKLSPTSIAGEIRQDRHRRVLRE
jgi:hypothetical protein